MLPDSGPSVVRNVREQRDSMVRRYALDALVVVLAFAACLLALEAFHTWQRVEALWTWAGQVQAQAAANQRPAGAQPAPQTDTPKK